MPDGDLRQPMTPTGLSMLGLIKHLAYAERLWFSSIFAGENVRLATTAEEWKAVFTPGADESAVALLDGYRRQIESSRRIVASATLDTLARGGTGLPSRCAGFCCT